MAFRACASLEEVATLETEHCRQPEPSAASKALEATCGKKLREKHSGPLSIGLSRMQNNSSVEMGRVDGVG